MKFNLILTIGMKFNLILIIGMKLKYRDTCHKF